MALGVKASDGTKIVKKTHLCNTWLMINTKKGNPPSQVNCPHLLIL